MAAVLAIGAAVFLLADSLGGNKDLGAAPDFTAETAAGEAFTLSAQYKAGGVALIFFDRTASDGKALLTDLAAAKKDTDVTCVLISKGEQKGEDILTYLKETGLSADVVIAGSDGTICKKYNVETCPVTYFINTEGSVRAVSLSSLTPSAAQKYIGYIK